MKPSCAMLSATIWSKFSLTILKSCGVRPATVAAVTAPIAGIDQLAYMPLRFG